MLFPVLIAPTVTPTDLLVHSAQLKMEYELTSQRCFFVIFKSLGKYTTCRDHTAGFLDGTSEVLRVKQGHVEIEQEKKHAC